METSGELPIVLGIYRRIYKANPELVNMQPVGFRITRILADSICPKTSQALIGVSNWVLNASTSQYLATGHVDLNFVEGSVVVIGIHKSCGGLDFW